MVIQITRIQIQISRIQVHKMKNIINIFHSLYKINYFYYDVMIKKLNQ